MIALDDRFGVDAADGFSHSDFEEQRDTVASPLPIRLTAAVTRHVLPRLVGQRSRSAAAALPPTALHLLREIAFDDPTVRRFVSLVEEDDIEGCESFALAHAARTEDPQATARALLEPAARMIGAGWIADAGDFLRVTFSVSRLQRLFRKMVAEHPPMRRAEPQKLALLAPAPGEQHSFGLAIIEDALRRGGWEVDCCTGVDETEMFRLAAQNRYRFIGLSVSGETLLPSLGSAIARLKAKSRNRSVSVVAGGSLVQERPELALAAGADFVGGSSRSVLRLADSFIASDRPVPVRVAAE